MSGKLFIGSQDLEISFLAIVGQKAVDISTLPSMWVPNYFVISSDLFERWKQHRSCSDLLSREELTNLGTLIQSLVHSEEKVLIVRSSSSDEGMGQRGKYLSQEIRGSNVNKLLDCIQNIYFNTYNLNVDSLGDSRLALIVQEFKQPIHSGHLSNERRIARRIQDWVYEFETGKNWNFAIKSHYKNANPETVLKANNHKQLINTLRNIATYFDYLHQRRHLEWVWDGNNVWVVQGDGDIELVGNNPAKYLEPSYPIEKNAKFQILNIWSEANSVKWNKISNQLDFKKARLPTYPIWVLESPVILEQIARGVYSSPLLDDLTKLAKYPIVIRSDIDKNKYPDDKQNLPRSDNLNSINKIQEFLSNKSKELMEKYSPEGFCFILHQYIPCKSSALCFSKKDNPRVKIDAIWGLADGLQYFQHDTYEYDTSIGIVIHDGPDYKEKYLAPDPKGKWEYVYSGNPWDWKSSLTEGEIHAISMGSITLSKLLQKDIVTMWFAGIPQNTNIPAVIPWWFDESENTTGIVTQSDQSAFNRNVVLITSSSDLDNLESGPKKQEVALKLNPGPDLLRDTDFIDKIIKVAKAHDRPVQLCGSPLSHAYYRLQNKGVKVTCEAHLYRKSKISKSKVFEPKYFNKLVRDKIPQIILSHGEHVNMKKISSNELVEALKRKTIEEAYEIYRSDNEVSIREELSDLYEVMMTLAQIYQITPEMIKTTAKNKKLAKGGFKEGTYLLQTLEIPLMTSQNDSTLIFADQLGIISKASNLPEFQNRTLTIPLVPPLARPIMIKLSENVKPRENQSVYLQIKYENTKISIEFIISDKTKQSPELIIAEPNEPVIE
jgi:predicted house-cleaning noncanonical NTP pyrophosphatase (MazG superfamily)